MQRHRRDKHIGTPSPGRRRLLRRDDVLLMILELLSEHPRHGYDIILELEERSRGFYSPSPGVIYPSLQALEDREFVTATHEAGGKKVYSITEAGNAFLDQNAEQAVRVREQVFSPESRPGMDEWPGAVRDMKAFFDHISRAMRSVAHDPQKVRQIREVVTRSRQKIDDIVAR